MSMRKGKTRQSMCWTEHCGSEDMKEQTAVGTRRAWSKQFRGPSLLPWGASCREGESALLA